MRSPRLEALIARRIGVDPSIIGEAQIGAAVAHRMVQTAASNRETYEAMAADDDAEFQNLIEDVVVPETWFLRNGEAFDELVRHARRTQRPGTPLRVLSLPCSSGEEPYSAAIALLEAGFAPEAFAIDGVDISRRAIERARAAQYGPMSFRGVAPDVVARYFVESGGLLKPVTAVRQSVRFTVANAVSPGFVPPGELYDVIFCRNLLIYLRPGARASVLDTVLRHLSPGGLVISGHAEALSALDPRFERVGREAQFAYRRVTLAAEPEDGLTLAMASAARSNTPRGVPPGAPRGVAPGASHTLARGSAENSTQRPPQRAQVTSASREVSAGGSAAAEGLARAGALADRGAWALAVAIVDDVEARAGAEIAAAQHLRATIALARGAFAEAEVYLVRALELGGDQPVGLTQLLLLTTRRGDLRLADELRERIARTTRSVS